MQRCPKCYGEIISASYKIGGKGQTIFRQCENTLKFDKAGNQQCDYTEE